MAPAKAAIIAGIPNLKTTLRLANLPSRYNLKRLFRKCTRAVKAIAISTGKNKMKAGNSKEPNPNPENNVNPEAKNATLQTSK